MKELIQKAGGRLWYGDEIVSAQTESLAAIQGFFKNYGACVLQGCDVTSAGSGQYNISSGLIALDDPTYGFKVVRFAGTGSTPVSLPGYFKINTSVIQRAYDDTYTKETATDFTAEYIYAAGGPPNNSSQYLIITSNSVTRFENAFANKVLTPWQAVSVFTAVTPSNNTVLAQNPSFLNYRINKVSKQLYLQGRFTPLFPNQGFANPYADIYVGTLPSECCPAVIQNFHGFVEALTSLAPQAQGGIEYIHDGRFILLTNGQIRLQMTYPNIPDPITFSINAILQLD